MTRTTFAVTTLSRLARPQRHRLDRHGRGQHPDHGRRHRRRRARPRPQGDRATTRSQIEVIEQTSPARSPPSTTRRSRLLEATIGELFPDAVPAPYVMMAATDSRHFTAICERVYRFAPFRMTKAQRESIHSYDEHLGVDAFLDGVRWYRRLIERHARSMTGRRTDAARPTPGRAPAGSAAWPRSSASWSASSSPAASCRATTRRSGRTSPTTSASATPTSTGSRPPS